MGLFDKFFKKDSKETSNTINHCKNFSNKFMDGYNEYLDSSNYNKNNILFNLAKITEDWSNKCPNDANLHFAVIIIFKLLDYEMDFKEEYKLTTTFLKPSDIFSYQWFKSTAESLMDKEVSSDNFKDLDNLIHSGKKEISLNADIILEYGEESDYQEGIKIDVDDLTIDGNNHFIDADHKIPIFNVSGKNVTFKNFTFKNGYSKEFGSAINNRGDCTFEKCSFLDNFSMLGGGAIVNVKGSKMKIYEGIFKNNSSKDGGAIICGTNSHTVISKTDFISNSAENIGGAIINQGEMIINGSYFQDNESIGGGAIGVETSGFLEINDTTFNDNVCTGNGGAIYDSGIIKLTNSKFENNHGPNGGAINISLNGNLEAGKTDFINNVSSIEGSSIYNENDVKFEKCKFINHDCDNRLIFNKSSVKLFDCLFDNNSSKSLIHNDFGASADIFGGEIVNNSSLDSAIYNIGKFCSINRTVFKNNSSKREFSGNIYNGTELILQKPKLGNDKTVFNKGHIEFKKFTSNFEGNIYNQGTIEVISRDSDSIEDSFDFSFLENEIANCNKYLVLKENIHLNKHEIEFYEGGIELDIDDLVIDGRGNVIDGGGKSRIFHVTGKNITLKNIIFKNGCLNDRYDENTNGGGAIRTVTGSSLKIINCKFIDNECEGNGGAILNGGELHSSRCIFDNNSSSNCGGAIYNKNIFNSKYDSFRENKSRLAGAIYNYDTLEINEIISSNNSSNISQPIFNNNHIEIKNISLPFHDLIYDAAKFKSSDSLSTFKDLSDELKRSNNITLSQNIIFDFKKDFNFKDGIPIDLNENLVIDGNGHSIDAKNSAIFFDIRKSDKSITFKNVLFTNGYGNGKSIFSNDAMLIFENCRFIKNRSSNDSQLILNNNSLEVSDSIFSQNSANTSIVNNDGKMEVHNSVFINNSVKTNGIIYNNKELKLEKSKFESNEILADGAVIFNVARTSVVDAVNPSKKKLIAVLGGSCEISENIFSNNIAKASGRVILNFGKMDLKKSDFTSNDSKFDGSCILNQDEHASIEYCNFINNNSDLNGGAIENVGKVYIKNSAFKDNSSKLNGGSLYNRGKAVINDSIFENNNAKEGGGAILNRESLIIENTEFMSNSSDFGGSILNLNGAELKNCLFKTNISKTAGSAITNEGGEMDIANVEFIENTADVLGGAIRNTGAMKINDSEFRENISKKGGGAISNQQKSLLDISNCKFVKNSAVFSGAIDNISQLTIKDSTFNYNISQNHGGAISNYENSSLAILKTEFSFNNANFAGAIYNKGETTVDDCSFIENFVEDLGGAFFNKANANLKVNNTKCSANKARYGGAIYNEGETTVDDSFFTENFVEELGGAFFNMENANLKVNNTTCSENKAKNGSVLFTVNEKEYKFKNCKLEGNDLPLAKLTKYK